MPVTLFLLMWEIRSSVGNVIARCVLVEAGKECDEERVRVAVEESEGKISMATRVMAQRTALGKLMYTKQCDVRGSYVVFVQARDIRESRLGPCVPSSC